jgi:DDE_Tnp_1-associated
MGEVKSIIEFFKKIPDPRRGAGQRHEQTFVLLLVVMSTMSGYLGYRAIGDFIKRNKESLLEHLQPKKNRLPSFDTVRRIVQGIDFSLVSEQFYRWASQYVKLSRNEWVSVDGKVIGGTVTNANSSNQQFVSLVSLYCSKQKLVIGNQKVLHKKENEITIVQQLIEALKLEGVTFSLDALHCQKKRQRSLLTPIMIM